MVHTIYVNVSCISNCQSSINLVATFACYSFQYIPNLCKMPATTPQNVISANITYRSVPSLSECQTLVKTCFWIQCTY